MKGINSFLGIHMRTPRTLPQFHSTTHTRLPGSSVLNFSGWTVGPVGSLDFSESGLVSLFVYVRARKQ